MNIAIALGGKDLTSTVPDTFAEANYLIIFDIDRKAVIEMIDGENLQDKALVFAKKAAAADCEAIICGPIEKEPFLIIADEAMITRYNGVGMTGNDAIATMEKDALPYIKDYIGGEGCVGHH